MALRAKRIRRPGEWGKRQWVRVALSVVGLGMVVGSAWVVVGPQWPRYSNRHGIGGRICRAYRPMTGYGNGSESLRFEMRIVTRVDAGFEITPESSLDPTERCCDGVRSFCIFLGETCERRGFWAATRCEYYLSLEHYGAPEVEADERERIVRVAAESFLDLRAYSTNEVSQYAEQERLTGSHTLWSGYAINTATIIGLGMLLWFTPVVVMDVWRLRRWRRGGCAACGYDVRGLREDATVCPECGSALVCDAGDPGAPGPAPPQR